MTRKYNVTVSVTLTQGYEISLSEGDIPDGQTIEDVAHNRALEEALSELQEYPGAFLTTEAIEEEPE